MDYTELKEAAFSTADRADTETTIQYDNFLRYVEGRINRKLHVIEMTSRVAIATVADQEYYGLPVDYSGMRDIVIRDAVVNGQPQTFTLQYRTPSQMHEVGNIENYAQSGIYYTVINKQIRILPTQSGNSMEVVYYKHVPALTETEPTNWVLEENPDCYLYGLLAQISAFNKDMDSASLWKSAFSEVLDEIISDDFDQRWSSSEPLQVRPA